MNISDFKAALIGGGSRANQFRVELSFPSYVTLGVVSGQQAQFLCKAAQLPASTVENVPIQYRGKPVNFGGERTFQPWAVTIYADTTFNVRNALESWQAGVSGYTTTGGKTNPLDYQVDLTVHQLDRNGASIKRYTFADAYPLSVGAMQLDFDTANQISTFDVEFQYNYFTSNMGAIDDSKLFGGNVSVDTPLGTFSV